MDIHWFFLSVLGFGFVLQLYFIGWRKQCLSEKRVSREEFMGYWRGQRRLFMSCYLFGSLGLGALFISGSEIRALALALSVTIVLLLATDMT